MYSQTNIPPCINPVPLSVFLPNLVEICREYDTNKSVEFGERAEVIEKRQEITDRKYQDRKKLISAAIKLGLSNSTLIGKHVGMTRNMVFRTLVKMEAQDIAFRTGYQECTRWHLKGGE